MGLSDRDINEFQKLHEKRFGTCLPKKDAYEQAIKLLTVMQISYKPITKVDLKRVEARQERLSQLSSLQL